MTLYARHIGFPGAILTFTMTDLLTLQRDIRAVDDYYSGRPEDIALLSASADTGLSSYYHHLNRATQKNHVFRPRHSTKDHKPFKSWGAQPASAQSL